MVRPGASDNAGLARFSLGIRVLLLAAWIFLLGHKLGSIPPLGKFFNPFGGFWRNAETSSPRGGIVPVTGLPDSVRIEYDHRGVPHVFARSLYGMFFAQGYVTARDRLWQMDVQSRAGLGRLAEVMGPKLLRFDRERRRTGIAGSVRPALRKILTDSLSRRALLAYTAGVNAWIHKLRPAEYPFEFKLLDYAPEPWTPLKCVALIKNMQWTLSKGNEDAPLTHTLQKLGDSAFRRLYPLRNPGAIPIVPEISTFNSSPAPSPAPLHPVKLGAALPPQTDPFFTRPQPGAGSDNFVVAGRLTATGFPLLGNDPHLDLTLPSIWYEIQLQAGNINAYGVSLPGAPGVIIGFNAQAAWGETNGEDDVYDWIAVAFRDSTDRSYRWQGGWDSTRFVLDTIFVRGLAPVVDTQVWTRWGPVPVRPGEKPFDRNTPPQCALRWLALEPSNDLKPFLSLLAARDYASFRAAIADLHCPSQNFAFADSADIALVHQGRFPVKPPGLGRTVISVADSYRLWSSFVPDSLLPAAHNPARGWLESSNQEPADSTYPYYLGSGFYPSERAGRMGRLLQGVRPHSLTLAQAWTFALDDYSPHAAQALPLLLRGLDTAALSPPARRAVRILRAWNFHYDAHSVAAAIFDGWWKTWYKSVWENVFGPDTDRFAWPSRPVTCELLTDDPASPWFDDPHTPQRETAADEARAALETTVTELNVRPGGLDSAFWGRVRPLALPHLLRLKPLGLYGLAGDGCEECLDAQRGTHGPSWRMVVQLGNPPRAWGGYPGGQSGNPGSPAFTAFVSHWLQGQPYVLLYLKGPQADPDSIAYALTLKGRP